MANGYIGHGVETPRKLMHFDGIMQWLVGSCAGRYKHKPYYYVDLNAGSGKPSAGRDLSGSPLLAAEILHDKYGDNSYEMICIEEDEDNLLQLKEHMLRYDADLLVNLNRIKFIHGDNNEHIKDIIAGMNRSGKGLVFHDPNGAPTWELMKSFQGLPEQVDTLLYVAANRSVKAVHRASQKKGWGFKPRLKDIMEVMDKKQWLIRDPSSAHQWTFLLGTNWTGIKDWKKKGFYRLETEEGHRAFHRMDLTRLEDLMEERCQWGEALPPIKSGRGPND